MVSVPLPLLVTVKSGLLGVLTESTEIVPLTPFLLIKSGQPVMVTLAVAGT
jgi:hypothetical protein